MRIMENYADLKRKLDVINNEIEMFEVELEYWWFNSDNEPGKGMTLFGLEVAAERTDKKLEKLKQLRKMREFYLDIKQEIDDSINEMEGLEYQIGYKRFIQGLTYQEIADDLGYTHGYIRQLMSKHRKQEEEARQA